MPGRYLSLIDGQSHTLDSFWYAIVPAIEEDYTIVIVEVSDDGVWRNNIGRSRSCVAAIKEHVAVSDTFSKWFAPTPAFKRSSSSSSFIGLQRSSSSSSCVIAETKKQPSKKKKVVKIPTPVPSPAESAASSSDSEPPQPVSLLANLLKN